MITAQVDWVAGYDTKTITWQFPQVSNVDVAPTIAALLGLDMKSASGHTIREILEAPGAH
jgi:hypothetical protein